MKRLAIILASLLAASCVALLLVWSARLALLDWALERYLASQEQEAEVTVAELSLHHLLLTDLSSREVSARRFLVRFSPLGLLGGKLEEVRVEGLRAEVDLTAAGEGAAPSLPPLPPIHLSDSRLTFKTPQGPLALSLEGRLSEQEEILSARFYVTLESSFGSFDGPLDASFTKALEPRFLELDLSGAELLYGGKRLGPAVLKLLLQDQAASATLHLEDARNPLRLEVRAQSYDPPSGLSAELEGDFREDSPLWALAPLPGLSASGRLSGQIALPQLPSGLPPLGDPVAWLSQLLKSGATSGVTLRLEDLMAEGAPRPLGAVLSLSQDKQGASFDITLGEEEGPTGLKASGELLPEGERFRLETAFEGRASLADPFLEPLLPEATAGDLRFSGSLAGLVPESAPQGLGELQALAPTAQLDLSAAAVRYPGLLRDGEGSLSLTVSAEDEGLEATLAKGGAFSLLADPALGLPELLNSSDPLAVTLDEGLLLSLRQEAGGYAFTTALALALSQGSLRSEITGPFTGRLDETGRLTGLSSETLTASLGNASPLNGLLLKEARYAGNLLVEEGGASLSGRVEVNAALDAFQGLSTESLSFRGSLDASSQADEIQVTVAEGAEVILASPLTQGRETLSLAGPLRLGETRLTLRGALESAGGSLDLPAFTLTGTQALKAAEGGRITYALADNLLQGDAALPGLSLPGQQLEAEGLSLKARLLYDRLPGIAGDPETPPLELAIAAIRHPQAEPISLKLAAREDEEGLNFSGRLGLAGGQVLQPIDGSWNRASGRLRARLEPTPLLFSRSGLQPRDLSPLLTRLEKASGEVTVSAALDVSDGKPRASGLLELQGFSFTIQATEVKGLSGRIELSDLLAPRSKGPQTLTAESVDPALPLRGVTARFALEPGEDDAPLLLIESLEGMSDFGLVRVSDGRISPLIQEGSLRVSFPSLDLSQLTALLGVEGLSATGTLAGSLPVAIRGGTVVIDQGSLDEMSEGVIQYSSPTARQALAGGGESVTLMLDALENFQYQDFGVTLDKPSDEELTIGFSLEGRNPDVLDGYPFRFNINLTTDPTSLLQALRLGSDIGKLLLERTGTFPSSNP
jgi:hypothetical protein